MNHCATSNNNVLTAAKVVSTYRDLHKMVAYVEAHKTNSVIIARVYITEAIHKPTEAERRF